MEKLKLYNNATINFDVDESVFEGHIDDAESLKKQQEELHSQITEDKEN